MTTLTISKSIPGIVVRCVFVTLLVVMALPSRTEVPATVTEVPSVSISLPLVVPSETVQISYFLIGPFGGYGGYVAQRTGVHAYDVPASVQGKAASEIRMIVYASGCDIQTFVIPLAKDSTVGREFACQHIAMVRLSGQIVRTELLRDRSAELVVTYMAYWAHGFYGIFDGAVTEFRLATVSPAATGTFQVDLPYFSADAAADPSQRRASFWLMLRDSKTWNPVASDLEPDDPAFRTQEHNLRIRSQYPGVLKFSNEIF